MPDQPMSSGSEDLYGDGPSPAPEPKTETSEAAKDEQGQETTALLPKAILAGKEFKPGEEVVLKIVAMHDDEVEVAYATGEGKSESPTPPPPGDGNYD